MADFDNAFNLTMQNEGGFVLHKVEGDNGGWTFAGIAENFWPNWAGWPIVRECGEQDPRLTPLVKQFYREHFWNKMKGDDICEQETAFNIFDFGVNAGMKTSIKIAQQIAGVIADGVIGPKSLEALNAIPGKDFDYMMFAMKMERYSRIVKANRSQSKFLLGWTIRSLNVLKA